MARMRAILNDHCLQAILIGDYQSTCSRPVGSDTVLRLVLWVEEARKLVVRVRARELEHAP